jgi:similar to stage IV sporulation protein
MSSRIFDRLGGTVQVKLTGSHTERILNLLLSRGVYIWDVRAGEGGMALKVRASGFKALEQVAQANGCGVEIVKKSGLPFVRRALRRRLGLGAGALLFVGLLYAATSFIWLVSVSGGNKVSEGDIMAVMRENGLYPGAFKRNFDRLQVEKALLKRLSRLAYAEISVNGVRASVTVVEKVWPEDGAGPRDLVARRAGVIEEVLVLEGTARVRAGEAVRAGEVLIAGVRQAPPARPDGKAEGAGDIVPARASGAVRARVWYEGYGESALLTKTVRPTGERARSFTLITPLGEWRLWGGEERLTLAERIVRERRWLTPLGEMGWRASRAEEQAFSVIERTNAEALEKARFMALTALLDQEDFPGAHTEVTYQVLSRPSDTVVRVKATAELIEDIALPRAAPAS